MAEQTHLELLERPVWVRVKCEWFRGGLRKLRQILRAPSTWARHCRLVHIANEAVYLMRDNPLHSRSERFGGAEGGAVLHLIVDGLLRRESGREVALADVLRLVSSRLGPEDNDERVRQLYLDALGEVTPSAAIHDLAYDVLQEGFPNPMDLWLVEQLTSLGWAFEHVPFETVTVSQAFADDPRERGGPDNLMNHMGRLLGWADSYPSWNFNVDGWEPIRFNGIPEGELFKDSQLVMAVEGYPLPVGAGPAYAEVRRRVLAGEPFEVTTDRYDKPQTIRSKIFPVRRALLHPVGFLRVKLEEDEGADAPDTLLFGGSPPQVDG